MNSPFHWRQLAALACLVFVPFARADTTKAEPPRDLNRLIDVLFRAPDFERIELSPDGSHLAFTQEVRKHKVIATYDFTRRKLNTGGADPNQGISDFNWVGPDQLLLTIGTDEHYYVGLWLVDENLKKSYEVVLPEHIAYLVQDPLPQKPEIALLREHPLSNYYSPLYSLSTASHRISLVERNPGNVINWLTDLDGVPRVAIVSESNSQTSYRYRENAAAPWRAEALPKDTEPLIFTGPGQVAFLTFPDANGRTVAQAYDFTTHQLLAKPVADPVYNVAPVWVTDDRTGTPLGFSYQAEKPVFVWLDPQYQKLHALLLRSFPGQIVDLSGVLPGNRVLFRTSSDVASPTIYLFDLNSGKVERVLTALPDANAMAWAPMTPITFAARDGYNLHGYLTLPRHRADGSQVPLVALSHGGPQVRDTWGFESEVQFLAALGYAVLQVDYRGSIGYGKAHELGNLIEVNEKSVDDVVDGIRWAVQSGYADPKRLAAYGGSYGGYISLAIATRYPDLLAATVGFAGVYDWEDQMKDDHYGFYHYMKWRADFYPDVRTAADRYRFFSPANHAADVRCPVLLMHGGIDRRVDVAQSKKMAAALRAAGKSVEVIKDAEGTHGLPLEEERRAFYRQLAEFLQKNVPVAP